MGTIQRPVKTYGTRKYVDEVAAAPGNEDPVLANEVDDDLETIYGAWNGGADTVNLKDGAVTVPKLDPAIQGAAQARFPGAVTLAPRMSLVPTATYVDTQANTQATPSFDNTKPGWMTRLDYGSDAFQVWRAAPPGAGAPAWGVLLGVDSTGNVTVPGWVNNRARASGIFATVVFGPIASGNSGPITMSGVWINSGNLAGNSVLIAPAFDCWVMLYAFTSVDRNGSFGIAYNIEEFNGSAWVADASMLTTATNMTLSVFRPAPANRQFRVTIANVSGGPINVTRSEFTMGVLGAS